MNQEIWDAAFEHLDKCHSNHPALRPTHTTFPVLLGRVGGRIREQTINTLWGAYGLKRSEAVAIINDWLNG